jgi:peptide/nickel transport system permease protein
MMLYQVEAGVVAAGKQMLPFLRRKSMATGLILVALMVTAAVFAPFFSPFDPIGADLHNNILPPSLEHPFGTDNMGRDVFSRVMHGARVDLLAGLFIVSVSVVIGVTLGILAGYRGGVIDKMLVGAMDTFLALPEIILALVIISAIGPGTLNAGLSLSLLGWVKFARIARSSTLSVREKEFIETARAAGAGSLHIISRHVLPNVIATISTLATLQFGHAILSLAALGFLGLGAQPPAPEWGAMLNEGRVFIRQAWWLSVFPGLFIVITVLACNLLSDGLRDILDPRLRRRVVSL